MNTCKTCIHYDGSTGSCLWAQSMPPILRELFNALESEPATHISFATLADADVTVSANDTCSQFTEATND